MLTQNSSWRFKKKLSIKINEAVETAMIKKIGMNQHNDDV